MTVKIENGIPLSRDRYNKYPWHQMNVGDSFLFPQNIKSANTYSVASNASKNGKQFLTRSTPDGYRCWRVS